VLFTRARHRGGKKTGVGGEKEEFSSRFISHPKLRTKEGKKDREKRKRRRLLPSLSSQTVRKEEGVKGRKEKKKRRKIVVDFPITPYPYSTTVRKKKKLK